MLVLCAGKSFAQMCLHLGLEILVFDRIQK